MANNKEAAEGSPRSLKDQFPLIHQHGTDGEIIHHGLKRPLHHDTGNNSPLPLWHEITKEAQMQGVSLYPPSHPCQDYDKAA